MPEQIVRTLGLEPGDELIVAVDEDNPEMIQIRPLHRSHAGARADLFGTPEEAREYVRAEQESWGIGQGIQPQHHFPA
ncbi:MAG: AbrB/MazE/SpoVT family DNA-binding domain-containing protein [Chloroflexi bacterium]|nr:AbrB/MazE/SpoVT family DNA-binding domain-containing protein [Chloroflexota bacterium]